MKLTDIIPKFSQYDGIPYVVYKTNTEYIK